LKRLISLAAMLAMVLVAAAPAIAQVSQESEQGVDSGDSSQSFTVSGSGASANDCAAILAAAQSGNGANSTGVLQSNGANNGVKVDDSGNFTINPELAEECEQKINQAASAASPKAASPKAEASKAAPAAKAEEKAATTQTKSETTQTKSETTQAKAEAKTGEKKELPKTGGDRGSLFALGAGALLVGGGLLARRIIR
jgi:LPXTG-motif cell wall-anchored protein